jgi:hypothetical protein
LDVASPGGCPAAAGRARGASIAAKAILVHDDAVADDHELTGKDNGADEAQGAAAGAPDPSAA